MAEFTIELVAPEFAVHQQQTDEERVLHCEVKLTGANRENR